MHLLIYLTICTHVDVYICFVDLQCQVMGDVIEVQWFYNDTLLDTGMQC